MTKERYIELRNASEIPMDDWFNYYKDRGGSLEREKFEEIFTTLVWNQAIVQVRGVPKQISIGSALNNFYGYYNKKFEL